MSEPEDVPIRDAATVVLLRDGDDGIEVWLLTRVSQMTFAAGMSVFPGGRIEDDDADLPITGGDFASLATRFDCSERVARALVGGAVRETFEEAGVLIAVPSADLSGAREDVEHGRLAFGELLRANDVAIDASALMPWSRWVTPMGEVRRYDTRFFVAALPDGAQAQDVTTESSEASWLSIGTALQQGQRGERRLLPPTVMTLASLQGFATVAEALASSGSRVLDPVRPTMTLNDDGSVTVELPGGETVTLSKRALTGSGSGSG